MVEANKAAACRLAAHGQGVFRTVRALGPAASEVPDHVAGDHAIQQWLSCSGQYEVFDATAKAHTHLFLNTDRYTQVTSPIRRLVDLLNQTLLCATMGTGYSPDARAFVERWLDKIAYINASMRSIRKVQTDCAMLYQCVQHPDVLQEEHEGVVFDKIVKQNGLIGYMVYLDKLKWLTRITMTADVENHSRHRFRLFHFESECQTKKKIRCAWVQACSEGV
jgi:exoribonuclease R